jgi:hypothetical protein
MKTIGSNRTQGAQDNRSLSSKERAGVRIDYSQQKQTKETKRGKNSSSFPSFASVQILHPPFSILHPPFSLRRCRALTVLEMLVSTACLVFIVVGLTAMFVQVQRAFKAGVKQSTMTDAGHTIIDLVAADLAQASDAQNTNIVNLYWGWAAMNTSSNYQDIPADVYRTNQLQEIYVLVHTNTQWLGTGYAISNFAGTGAGTLYQYLASTNDPLQPNNFLFSNFFNGVINQSFNPGYFHRVADGVVHLKIRVFDQYGNENGQEQGMDFFPGNTNFSYPAPAYTNMLGVLVPPAGLPATIQLEVGILEPDAFEQLRALPPNSQAQRTFLATAGGKIQIYRQNIPVAGAIR